MCAMGAGALRAAGPRKARPTGRTPETAEVETLGYLALQIDPPRALLRSPDDKPTQVVENRKVRNVPVTTIKKEREDAETAQATQSL